MAIRQRGDSFQADVRINGVRSRKDFATEQEARVYEAAVKLSDLTGKPMPVAMSDGGWTMAQAYKRTLAVRWAGRKAELGLARNGRAVRDHFGPSRQLSTVEPEEIADYAIALAAIGNAPATVNRKLAALSAMFRTAYDERKITALPKIKRKREGAGRIRFLSPEEEAQMFGLLRQWGDFADVIRLYEFLLDTGLRLGEGLRVAPRDLSPVKGGRPLLSVWENKGDAPRSVPLTTRAEAAFRAGAPFKMNYNRLRSTWDRLRVAMELEDDEQFVMHMLRHTCASRLVQRGVAIQVVQQWLGHKTISQTLRYAHLAPKNFADAVMVLEVPCAVSV